MVLKVGINGFGRVGRVVLRTCLERSDVKVCAINDPAIDINYVCYLIKYDSTHGTLRRNVNYSENEISIDDVRIVVFHEKFPTGIPWHTAGVEYVVEASGMFTSQDKASGHLVSDSVKRVIVTAPCVDVPMIIFGVNEETIKSNTKVISCGSSTLYCLAPIIKILEDNYGVEEGFITSIHAMTPSLKPLDGLCLKGKHWRDHRSITQNIIPAATGACKALGRIIPAVKDRMCGLAFRVPIANVSVMDLSIRLKKVTCIANIAENIEKFNETTKNIIKITSDESVSSDFIGDSYSCILDINSSIQLKPNAFKLICWYENEYSYACRVIDLINFAENQFIELHRRAIMGATLQSLEGTLVPPEKKVKLRPKTANHSSVGLKNRGEVCNKKAGENSVPWFNSKSVLMGKIWNDGDGTVRNSRSTAFFQPYACVPRSPRVKSPCKHFPSNPRGNSPTPALSIEPPPEDAHGLQTEDHTEYTSQPTICNKAQERLEKVKQEFTKMVNMTETLLKKSQEAKINRKTSSDSNEIIDKRKLGENQSISTLKAIGNFTQCSSSISDKTDKLTNPLTSTSTLNSKDVVDSSYAAILENTMDRNSKSDFSILLAQSVKEDKISNVNETQVINNNFVTNTFSEILIGILDLQRQFSACTALALVEDGKEDTNDIKIKESHDHDVNYAKAGETQYSNTTQNEIVHEQLLEPIAINVENVKSIDNCYEKDNNSKLNLKNDTQNEPQQQKCDETNKEDSEVDKVNKEVDEINKEDAIECCSNHDRTSATDVSKHDNAQTNVDATMKDVGDDNLKENPFTDSDVSKHDEISLEENPSINDQPVPFSKVSNVRFDDNCRDGEVRQDDGVSFEENACTHRPKTEIETDASWTSRPHCTDKEDIYDKLDSESDSDHSFSTEKKKSQILKIADLTNSLEDLDRLDKICKIMEISDELSDELFSTLNKNSESNSHLAKTRWSFKDLCERVDLDEFCNNVFGK
ncbi:hypothetical protein O0L34_g325 [Tuta absoluta]|nr:hypothetical protein O0L34_g325 [Tuta absoluta]